MMQSFPEKKPKQQSVTLKRLCNFSWKTQLSAAQYFLMKHNNLVARLWELLFNTTSSTQPPGTMCLSNLLSQASPSRNICPQAYFRMIWKRNQSWVGDGKAIALLYRRHTRRAVGPTLPAGSSSRCSGAPQAPVCFQAGSPFYGISLLGSQTVTEFFQLKLSKIKQRMVRQIDISFVIWLSLSSLKPNCWSSIST